ncbi:MAG: GTP pyrophosphokinase family protein [Lachnospiraceae bacterium]|nr:GTP pyrophosphokinase family protein [Lachnospiraceae bacterium]
MNKATDMGLEVLVNTENPEQTLKDMQPFIDLMMNYECALMEIETKLKILNTEFTLRHNRNPFESIKCRVKQPISIIRKLQKKGLDITIENIENNLTDIAGVRVICSFPEDIYTLSDLLSKQDDIKVVTVKDYIRNPKKNGYRSLHLIVSVPIYLSDETKQMNVEVQFRTIAMDFWASLDHKLKYKKDNLKHPEIIEQELKKCADTISALDYKMQEIRNMLED